MSVKRRRLREPPADSERMSKGGRLREPPADSERMSKGGRIENDSYENKEIKDFLDLKEDEIYYFSYAEDLDEINKKLNTNIIFYGSGELMNYSRIFVIDALVSLEYESSSSLYGIVIKLKKDDFNKLFEYENKKQIKSKMNEINVNCELYNDITHTVKSYSLKSYTFMKIGLNEDLKLKKLPTIDQMLSIRKMLNSRHKINKYINSTRLYIKGYYFSTNEKNEPTFDIDIFGIFRNNSEFEIATSI